MANPANGEIRGLEIVTNGQDNAAYWQSMMAIRVHPARRDTNPDTEEDCVC
ncbi:restriction endonuclease fold toxin-2 domain-containing protein [Streptomyces sp. NPDC029004]|uniref:restriction endonuclease fold toxin-2 domain-containing protein n=1 Tax=Streptomyces sp. NPDC029004 TaxID=3154490 RepID=UPI0033E8AD30